MPNPHYLLVAKGRKTEDAIIEDAKSYRRDLPDKIKRSLDRYSKIWASKNPDFTERQRFFKTRDAYTCIKTWAFAENEKRMDVPFRKPDRLEMIGGIIDEYEFEHHPIDYGDYSLPREFCEESGLIIVDSNLNNMFEDIATFYEKDRTLSEDNCEYKQRLYWIVGATRKDGAGQELKDKNGFPNPRSTGVKNETFPAFYIEVKRLVPHNFHRKHAFFLKYALEWRIELGETQYQESLEHMKSAGFVEITLPTKPTIRHMPNKKPENVSDEELFLREMADVRPLQ